MSEGDSIDRRLGRRLRTVIGGLPGGRRAAAAASDALAPSFVLLVLGLIALPRRRRAGVESAVAAGAAALVARVLRDGIGRPRPGERRDGGFPSRHAAAAVAIAGAVGRRHPAVGAAAGAAAAVGLAGRVADAQHDPADIVAGAALGWAAAELVGRVAGRVG